MTDTPNKYQATPRLIDDPDRLEELYCEEGLSVREIASRTDVDFKKSMIGMALNEYDITRNDNDEEQRDEGMSRGIDPPTVVDSDSSVDWSTVP